MLVRLKTKTKNLFTIMSDYLELSNFAYVPYRHNKKVLTYSTRQHLRFNIWHDINGFAFIAKPVRHFLSFSDIYIEHNCYSVGRARNSKEEIAELYISPIIRYCSRKIWPKQHRLNRSDSGPPPTMLLGEWLVLAWSDDIQNYYHLLFDLCPKLMLIEADNSLRDLPILIVGKEHPLVLAVISTLFPAVKPRVRFIKANSLVVQRAIFPLTSQPSYLDTESIWKLSARIKNIVDTYSSRIHQLNHEESRGLIYVSRGKGRNGRFIINEEEFGRALQNEFDAQFVNPNNLDPLEQWASFSKARIIISPHGAALTNLLAAKEGSIVIELLPQSFQPSTFSFVCASLNLGYHRICYDDSNSTLPIEVILESLRKLLGSEYKLIGRER